MLRRIYRHQKLLRWGKVIATLRPTDLWCLLNAVRIAIIVKLSLSSLKAVLDIVTVRELWIIVTSYILIRWKVLLTERLRAIEKA